MGKSLNKKAFYYLLQTLMAYAKSQVEHII